jgi:hypothetical protein
MGLFSGIMNKIFGHAPAIQPVVPTTAPPAAEAPSTASPAAPPASPVVDVTAVLDDMAAHYGEKLDWRKSIVDLMKLVGMDSSLASRKELAVELGFTGDKGDSAKMNVWLHKEVIKQLAANGGKVPADLLD